MRRERIRRAATLAESDGERRGHNRQRAGFVNIDGLVPFVVMAILGVLLVLRSYDFPRPWFIPNRPRFWLRILGWCLASLAGAVSLAGFIELRRIARSGPKIGFPRVPRGQVALLYVDRLSGVPLLPNGQQGRTRSPAYAVLACPQEARQKATAFLRQHPQAQARIYDANQKLLDEVTSFENPELDSSHMGGSDRRNAFDFRGAHSKKRVDRGGDGSSPIGLH